MNHINQKVLRRAGLVLSIAASMAKKVGVGVENRVEGMLVYSAGYAEPGYDSPTGVVVVGDWNDTDEYVPSPTGEPGMGSRRKTSDIPGRVARILEKLGVEIEWDDEWGSCSDCGRLFRTQGDSYSWTASYHQDQDTGECLCVECLKEDPVPYLEKLEENHETANTISSIDPTQHGYRKVDVGASGWYGRNDSPRAQAKALKARGIERFLFNISGQGQFETQWDVWVHESCEEQDSEGEDT